MPAPSFEISPDGQHVVVAALSKGVSMLWVSPVLTTAWRPLEGTENAGGFVGTPDSQNIGFFAGDQLTRVGLTAEHDHLVATPAPAGHLPDRS
jgi:hypothetical protein